MPALLGSPVVLTVLAGVLLSSRAHALDGGEGADQHVDQVTCALFVNESPWGDVFPLRRGHDVLLAVEDLEKNGILVDGLGGRREVHSGKVYLLLSTVPNSTYELDERTTSLRVALPVSAFPRNRFDLKAAASTVPVARSEPNAFLNYGVTVRDLRPTFISELGATVGPAFFTNTLSWTAHKAVLRGLTQLTFDRPDGLVRLTAGDRAVNNGALGGGAILTGLHLFRNYDLDPYFTIRPSVNFAGSVSAPSTLEVYVNNTLVRRQQLPPGEFDVENVPLPTGANGARYVIRDGLGRTQEYSRNYSVAAGLLAPGVSSYDLALGFQRKNFATESFDYGGPVLLGIYRFGATPWLTPGFRIALAPPLMGDRAIASGGAMLAMQALSGEIDLEAAASTQEAVWGAAGSLLQCRWCRRTECRSGT